MVHIDGQQSVIQDRERERSRQMPGKSGQSQYAPHYNKVVEATSNYPTMNNYGAAQPPPPPTPIPSMLSQNPASTGSYPPPMLTSYPPPQAPSNKMSSYPPPATYYGMPQYMSPYQQGVVYAPPVLPDPSNSCNSALCAKHGKRRTLVNLSKDERGDWVCTKASECRTVPSSGSELCSIHGKKRSLQNLVQNKKGDWVCESHDECIVVPNNVSNKQLCSIHGKMRSLLHMVQSAPGMFVCAEGSHCYVKKFQMAYAQQAASTPYVAQPPPPLPYHLQQGHYGQKGAF